MLTDRVKSVLLIDTNAIDNYTNQKLLEKNGVNEVATFSNTEKALFHLKETNVKYHLILVDMYLPMTDGIDFINKFNALGLNNSHGEICVLSASLNPEHINKIIKRNVRFIEKPLTIDKLLSS